MLVRVVIFSSYIWLVLVLMSANILIYELTIGALQFLFIYSNIFCEIILLALNLGVTVKNIMWMIFVTSPMTQLIACLIH